MSSSGCSPSNIPDADERAEFLKKVAALKKRARPRAEPAPAPRRHPPPAAGGRPHRTRINFTPEARRARREAPRELRGAARAPAHQGRGRASPASLRELYTSLAAHIDDEDERRAFLDCRLRARLRSTPRARAPLEWRFRDRSFMTTIVVVRKGSRGRHRGRFAHHLRLDAPRARLRPPPAEDRGVPRLVDRHRGQRRAPAGAGERARAPARPRPARQGGDLRVVPPACTRC